MISIIVGGSFPGKKPSGIVRKIGDILPGDSDEPFNGRLPTEGVVAEADLIVWMPDISNEEEKDYPKKKKGAVLICSKVMREGYTKADAVARIFKMHGNAVICIYRDDPKLVRFELIDALGNTWRNTTDIQELVDGIGELFVWTREQRRLSYNRRVDFSVREIRLPQEFIDINTMVADKVENSMGSRFFGNFSTRCSKMFPTMRYSDDMYLVSPRNTDKRRLTPEDCVVVRPYFNSIGEQMGGTYLVPNYTSKVKPSVDTPGQMDLYGGEFGIGSNASRARLSFPSISFMIHGHAHIEGAKHTRVYFPCGDRREAKHIWDEGLLHQGAINLTNRGFLIMANSLEELRNIVETVRFSPINKL